MGKGTSRATHALTHGDLVLAAPGARRWPVTLLLMLLALALGAAGSFAWWRLQPADHSAVRALTEQQHALQQQLDEARLALRMAQGKAEGLERTIDGLNRQLGECQEQLTFFRSARTPQH
jgi:uncharacterized protein HemX